MDGALLSHKSDTHLVARTTWVSWHQKG